MHCPPVILSSWTDLSDCRHVAGAAVVLRGEVRPGGRAAGRAAAELTEGGAGRALVVEDKHRPAIGGQGVVHIVDCAQ